MLLVLALAAALQVESPPLDAAPSTEAPAAAVDTLAPEPDASAQTVEEVAPVVEPTTPAEPTMVGGRELDCEKYHFEIKVDEIDGKLTRPQSLKLCGYKGSTKASWLRTLRDVRMKVAGSDQLTAASKARADGEIGAEIIRISNEE